MAFEVGIVYTSVERTLHVGWELGIPVSSVVLTVIDTHATRSAIYHIIYKSNVWKCIFI